MAKGRNTSVVSVRLPDDVISSLKTEAFKRNLSLSEYLKQGILKMVSVKMDTSQTQLKPLQGSFLQVEPRKPCPCGATYPDGNFKQYRHCCGQTSVRYIHKAKTLL